MTTSKNWWRLTYNDARALSRLKTDALLSTNSKVGGGVDDSRADKTGEDKGKEGGEGDEILENHLDVDSRLSAAFCTVSHVCCL